MAWASVGVAELDGAEEGAGSGAGTRRHADALPEDRSCGNHAEKCTITVS